MNRYLKEGVIYVNQTKKYLLPVLRVYGEQYMSAMSNLKKLAVGYDDYAIRNLKIQLFDNEYNVFFLVDVNTMTFYDTLTWFRTQEYYVFDYAFDDVARGYQHMIVLRFPWEYFHSYDCFLKGRYSEMLSIADVKRFSRLLREKRVYLRDKSALDEFAKQIEKEYDVQIDVNRWDGEVDYPPFKSQEIFNYD